jgi:hypothetical protein
LFRDPLKYRLFFSYVFNFLGGFSDLSIIFFNLLYR